RLAQPHRHPGARARRANDRRYAGNRPHPTRQRAATQSRRNGRGRRGAEESGEDRGCLAHIPAKWTPVRRQEYAPIKESRAYSDSEGTEYALALSRQWRARRPAGNRDARLDRRTRRGIRRREREDRQGRKCGRNDRIGKADAKKRERHCAEFRFSYNPYGILRTLYEGWVTGPNQIAGESGARGRRRLDFADFSTASALTGNSP